MSSADLHRYGGQLLASHEYSPFNYCKSRYRRTLGILADYHSGGVSRGCARQHQRWPVDELWSQYELLYSREQKTRSQIIQMLRKRSQQLVEYEACDLEKSQRVGVSLMISRALIATRRKAEE